MATFDANLFGYLTAQSAFASLIADGVSPETYRLFPVRGPENPALPCVIYRTISAARPIDFAGPQRRVEERVQFDIVAETYAAAKAVFDKLRLALDGYSGTMGDMEVWYAHLDNQQDFDEPEADFRRVTVDFLITHTEGAS